MQFYIPPEISKDKYYYSWFSSFLFVILGVYFIVTNRATKSIQYTLLVVGVLSVIHNIRTFDDEYNDIIRHIDILFASLLAYLIYKSNPTRTTIIFGYFTLVLFLYISHVSTNSLSRSLLHSFLHILVCLYIFLLYYCKTQNNKSV